MIKLIRFLIDIVILALPTGSTAPKECANECKNNEEEEDSGPSSTEDGDSTSECKGKTEANVYIETATSHDRYYPVLPTFEDKNEERNCKEYGSPGPPDKHIETGLSQDITELRKSFSRLPVDQVLSETNRLRTRHREDRYQGEGPITDNQNSVSWGTLSEDNLSVDARACALPKRRPKGAKTKAEKLAQTEEKQRDKGDKHHKIEEEKIKRHVSIEDFVRQLVHTQISPQARIKFFDAAIVYEKEDYCAAMNFKEEVIMIVKSELNEEVRIELFDSEEFAQSKIIVVEDVLNKCSLVFVYLTVNFKSPELMFFIEEAIGMSRLGLNNMDIQAVTKRNDRQWVIKPVHTMTPKYRAYRVPTGLLSVNGIEWYNKDTPHTRQQICAVMHTAIQTRKEREIQGPISHLPRQMLDKTYGRQNPDRHVQGISNASNPNVENTGQNKHEHFISHQSHDAMSFARDSAHFQNSPFRSLPGGQNPIPAAENIYNSFQPTPRLQTNQVNTYNQSNWQSKANSFHGHSSLSHNYNPMFPQQDMTRTIPRGMRYSESVQSGQYPQMLSQTGQQYESLPTYQQQSPTFRGVFQTAGFQNRNEQPVGNGNVSEHSAQQGAYIYQGYTPTHNGNGNIYTNQNVCMAPTQTPGFPGHPPRGQDYTVQQNAAGVSVPGSYWQENPQVQSQIHGDMPMNMHRVYQQAPVRQQCASVQQQFNLSQDEPLTRDALHSEPGNFPLNQRNDAPPNAQLSVVSKVTGNLIVNPNLSTDDVEVDNYVSASNSHTKISRKSGKGKNSRTRRQMYTEYDSEDSSSDSDFDIPKSKLKRGKQKVVNVVGCKIVQMGSRNKVKERASKYEEVIDGSPHIKPKCHKLEMKQSPEDIGSSPARVSVSDHSLQQQRKHMTAAPESNVLSTDNMSIGSSILRNLDTGLGEKCMADKNDIPSNTPSHSDKRLHERGIGNILGRVSLQCDEQSLERNTSCGLNLSSTIGVKQVESHQKSFAWNNRNKCFGSETISQSENQDSAIGRQFSYSSEENLFDGDDYLFKSGTIRTERSEKTEMPDVEWDIEAPFMFSQAKKYSIEVLKESRYRIIENTQHGLETNEDSEID